MMSSQPFTEILQPFALFALFALGYTMLAVLTNFGSQRSILVLLPIFAVIAFIFTDWSYYIYLALAVIWTMILLGSARVTVWEMRERSTIKSDWWTLPRIIALIAGALAVAFGVYIVVIILATDANWFDDPIPALIFPLIITYSTVFALVHGLLSNVLSPLFSREPQEYSGKVEDFFCVSKGWKHSYNNNGRYHIIKFENCPHYWRVTFNQFKAYTESIGTVYNFTVYRGLFKMHFIRGKIEVEQAISEEKRLENLNSYQFLPNKSRNSRVRGAILLISGIIILITGIFSVAIPLMTVSMSGSFTPEGFNILMIGAIGFLIGLALLIFGAIKLARSVKGDAGQPLPFRPNINYRALNNTAAENEPYMY